ncbi:exodeoxyribonuclease III [Clostridium sp. UBA6640]|uniref:exodeoxyribonuclease III n=1 Tax=Clostridium sp. UBA6640 TaxID=1946370 RepID=UPI0025C57337|nr:exodeoxyribonuclease III [Clostridium sp. UBA6640]
MKIYSWNVNGLRAMLKKDFIPWIMELSPDILCIQETKLQEDNLDENITNIEGYHSYFSHGIKKGYSGVAIYTKAKPESIKNGIGIERFDIEGRILIAEYEDFTLMNIYFPNGQSSEERLQYKMEFYDAILDFCNTEVSKGTNLIICGDYNTAHTPMDIKNAKANEKTSGFLPMERAWIDKFISNGYIDTFRYINPDEIKYSWWSYRFKARERNAGWRIDYFFVSDNMINRVSKAEILNEVLGSDHCPITLEIESRD